MKRPVAVGPEEELSANSEDLTPGANGISSALEYWQCHKDRYPMMSTVALVLSAPASQAYTERIFSVSGDLTARKRNRLHIT